MTLPENLHVIEHPVVEHKLTYIRDETTQPKEFRELVKEVSIYWVMNLQINYP